MSDIQEPVFTIQRVYMKEASLEQPNSPDILREQEVPEVEIQLGLGHKQVEEGIFEVTVTATVTTTLKERTVFLVEVEQAGIFEIRNIPEEAMPGILNVGCPQIVYPYLRANIADLVQRAGFPAVQLAEIHFQLMWESQQAAEAGQQAGNSVQ